MKTMKKTAVVVLAILMISSTNIFAQKGQKFNDREPGERFNICNRIPDLTEDQQTKIETLRVSHLKEMNAYRNQMNELRAKKNTLMSTDGSDLKNINSAIDQMTDVHNKMMKASAKHHMDVRNLLTDDQKVYFDSMPKHGHGKGRGMGREGRGNRNFNGNGQGYGQGKNSGPGQGMGYGRGLNPNCPNND